MCLISFASRTRSWPGARELDQKTGKKNGDTKRPKRQRGLSVGAPTRYNSSLGEVKEPAIQNILAITKALADENRLRTLMALREGELCLCQLVELLGLAPSTVSKHLDILRQAGLIDRRKEGRWVFFRLAGKDAPPPVRKATRWISDSLADDERIGKDQASLERIRSQDLETLCDCYN